MTENKQRAPTLYAIISIKLLKGLLLVSLAFGVYTLAEHNLPELFEKTVRWVRLDPEKKFFSDITAQIGKITTSNVRRVATGTLIYSMLCFVEGIGLMFRVSWAGWLAIGEAAFFIPIEVYELSHEFTATLSVILVFNVIIVWYLYRNRQRLFHHGWH
jgi:uncharacterized membrane protein (DUF2068 family)